VPASSGFKLEEMKPNFREIRRYPLVEPFASAIIAEDEETGELMYYLVEQSLTKKENEVYNAIYKLVMMELPPPADIKKLENPRNVLSREIKRILDRYRGLIRGTKIDLNKMAYHMEKDLLGFGPIDAIMKDENIEDISADGVGAPIFIFHKDYETIPTNIVPMDAQALDDFVSKLIHMAGKHVSVAAPIVDAQLPDGSRIAITYKQEVSPGGSTFTIRKFKATPITFTQLIQSHNISPEIAAYFWLMLDNHKSFLVLGVTGAGKTTFLNAMATFLRPNLKIITVEEVPEVRLPHKNWIRLTPRLSFGPEKTNEVTLFDLVKATLRMRPDYLIVGEVRGEETYVLFQAVNTGHGGVSTMHAEDFTAAINRLTSPPMNVPKAYIPAMNIFVMVRRVRVGERLTRRVTEVGEVQSADEVRTVFRWDPKNDVHVLSGQSFLLREIAETTGQDEEELEEELRRRTRVINWMVEKNMMDFHEVARMIERYYTKPEKVLAEVEGIAEVETT